MIITLITDYLTTVCLIASNAQFLNLERLYYVWILRSDIFCSFLFKTQMKCVYLLKKSQIDRTD